MKIKQFFAVKIFILSLILSFNSNAAVSDWQYSGDKEAKVRLISSSYKDENNKDKIIYGLHFILKDGWKIYGNDSNGIGLPPSLDFKNPTTYKIFWPTAIPKEEKIGKETIHYSIYKDEVVLPLEINSKNNSEITVKLNYGLCKDVCIPASSEFKFKATPDYDENALKLIQNFSDKNLMTTNVTKTEKQISSTKINSSKTLIIALISSFIGGLILNVMPCVLPVLGIKLMSIIDRPNATLPRIRLAFFSTILGIISCFTIFAVLAGLVSFTGNIFNWGLQFQNPNFITFLMVIVTFFIAHTLGLFDITFDQFLSNFINRKIDDNLDTKKNIFVPNFLSGILAVMLATPCSAPFLGSAITFATTQEIPIIFTIFLIMGFGFAFPYFFLLIFPNMVRSLPKPGLWMVRVKEIMSLLLIATLLWLAYVFNGLVSFKATILTLVLSALLLASFKIKFKFFKMLAFGSIIITFLAIPSNFESTMPKRMEKYESIWINFDELKLYKLVREGKTVVVDVTADWCLTCKFNKINVLHDKKVMDKLGRDNIVAMRADITRPNEEVMKFLNKNGRYAIPFNAVYGPNAKTGLLASELLTKKELLQLIEQAEGK